MTLRAHHDVTEVNLRKEVNLDGVFGMGVAITWKSRFRGNFNYSHVTHLATATRLRQLYDMLLILDDVMYGGHRERTACQICD